MIASSNVVESSNGLTSQTTSRNAIPVEEGFSFGDDRFRICGRIDRNNTVVQYFRAPDDYLSGISLRFGTYLVNWPHRLILSLHAIDDDVDIRSETLTPSVVPIFQIDVAASGVSNDGYFNFYFCTLPNSKGRLFAVTIASTDGKDGEALTAWLTRFAHSPQKAPKPDGRPARIHRAKTMARYVHPGGRPGAR